MTAMDQATVLAAWRARGFLGGLWTDAPGQVWKDFVHDVDELMMVVEGRVELEMCERAFVPERGEEVLIPARTRHTVRNIGGSTARWLYAYRRG